MNDLRADATAPVRLMTALLSVVAFKLLILMTFKLVVGKKLTYYRERKQTHDVKTSMRRPIDGRT